MDSPMLLAPLSLPLPLAKAAAVRPRVAGGGIALALLVMCACSTAVASQMSTLIENQQLRRDPESGAGHADSVLHVCPHNLAPQPCSILEMCLPPSLERSVQS